ncbi:MAG TPA: ATP-binding protein, partial [Bacteroidia bacterium]|nr:ATP-binding protein [Bacteroidia bacterium]
LVLTACMKEHKPGNIEHEFKYPDGSKGWFELRIQPVPEGLFILSVDISVVKRAQSVIELMNLNLERKVEERTKELERANKELESFSYSISHDLRAPLRAIDGYTRIFMEDHAANADDEGKRLLKVIIDSTARMAHLIDDLLSFSRTGKQEMVKVKLNMNQIAHAITEEQVRLMSAKNARVIIGELPESDGDVRMIRQVFVNLVSNAVKYSSKKKDPVIEIGSLREGEETVYFVKDNGAGFDMRYYEKLFAVFQRLHSSSEFEGTGVGLAIVERIITRHGGRIWAKSELNEGAVFYFTLGNK